MQLLEMTVALRMLELKADAQAMSIKEVNEGLVNGSVGKVRSSLLLLVAQVLMSAQACRGLFLGAKVFCYSFISSETSSALATPNEALYLTDCPGQRRKVSYISLIALWMTISVCIYMQYIGLRSTAAYNII
jgi:hypothetical protein